MDENDPVFLSLADALTCVLGAAIALFLIFVTLVKVAPTVVDVRSDVTARIERAVGKMATTGASDVVLRVVSADCVALQSLALSLEHEAWWTETPDRGTDTCERLFQINERVALRVGELRLARRTTETLHLVLVVGAERWPPVETWRVEASPGCRRSGLIATLSLYRTPPLIEERCPS